MKKIYLSLIFGGLSIGTINAQQIQKAFPSGEAQIKQIEEAHHGGVNNIEKAGVEIWSNNFDTPADWVIDNDGQTGATYGWTIDAVSDGWFSAAGINSTSGGNFAELANGDPTQNPGTQAFPVEYTLTLAAPIDIPNLPANTTNTDQVSLQWEEYGAKFYDNQSVQVSTDGSTWTTVHDNSAYEQYTASGGSPYANPQVVNVNIASFVAGNPNNVYIRFSWTSEFPGETNPNAWVAYGWFIDDVKIITLPDDDMQLWSVYVVGENNDGMEYGRTPQDHADPNWAIGGQVFNNGVNDQTNAVLTADFTAFTATANEALLVSLDTIFMETVDPLSLTPAIYSGTYTLESDNEMVGSPDFADNTGARQFEITDPVSSGKTIYSIDGVGVYSGSTTGSIGTDSFTGGEDGLVVAALYYLKQAANVSGVRVMLASGTQAGAELYASIKDTATFFADDMTSLYQSAPVTITNLNVSQGYVDVLFPSVYNVPAGGYFAAVEMYSNGGTSDIRVVDDETVEQPYYASMIYIPGDAVYSNGTAIGVRMLMGDNWGVGLEENTLAGVSIYPNPSEGMINVTNDEGTNNTIVVYDVAGRVVTEKSTSVETTLDLTSVLPGTYIIEVSNENGSITENVVIK